MTKPKQDLAAPIPVDLAETDETLHRFGRWAMHRTARRRCGSAEGKYRAPANDDDRMPAEMLMHPIDAMRVQRALARIPRKWRLILEVLYVPKRGGGGRIIPVELWFRVLRIPPNLSRERHLEGLTQFRNIHAAILAKERPTVIMRAPCTTQEIPACLLAGPVVSEAEAVS